MTNKPIDAGLIEGRELIQLAVGKYQLILAFEGDVTLAIESSIRFKTGELEGEWITGNPLNAAPLTGFVGLIAETVNVAESEDIVLEFPGKMRIIVLGKAQGGEACQVTFPGGIIVV